MLDDVSELHWLYQCAFDVCGFVISPWCSECPVTMGSYHPAITINEPSLCWFPHKKEVGSPSAHLSALGIEDASPLEESFSGGAVFQLEDQGLPPAYQPEKQSQHSTLSVLPPQFGRGFSGDLSMVVTKLAGVQLSGWGAAGNQKPGGRAEANTVDCYEFKLRPA